MRRAAASESATQRVQLARQAVRELHALRSKSRRERRVPSRHQATIAGLASQSSERPNEYETLADAFAWLERQIDTRTPRERIVNRAFGHALLAAALATGGYWAFSSKNLALGKEVTASSICDLTPQPPLGQSRLQRLVDGRPKEQGFAICTELEVHPWVTVDLAREARIDRVVVFPRNDCCYGDDELPIQIELSGNNRDFEVVGSSDRPATADFPWRFAIQGRRARYVRITSPANEKRHIVIGEIEVYGG
ncbi:MAG TPA: discoidin domain-containing protein [Polyangiaceae bacterium]|nr:discoidin domain-containing protein [Polyangiaceae bacterium]